MNISSQKNALAKLIKISATIANDENLLQDLINEIKSSSSGPLCDMLRAIFSWKPLNDFRLFTEVLSLVFRSQNISEYTLYDSPSVGIKCFFMPKFTSFPLHDHENQAVCTGILYGSVKCLALNRVDKNIYRVSTKATAKMSDTLFLTKDYRNVHSILALEDSVIIDIFMPNDDDSNFSVFQVVKKRGRNFELEKLILKKQRCCEH